MTGLASTAARMRPAPLLTGQRCTPRALMPADALALQRHADDPAVAFNLFGGFPQPCTLADAQAWCGVLHPAPQFATVWSIDVVGAHGWEVAGCRPHSIRKAGQAIDAVAYGCDRPGLPPPHPYCV